MPNVLLPVISLEKKLQYLCKDSGFNSEKHAKSLSDFSAKIELKKTKYGKQKPLKTTRSWMERNVKINSLNRDLIVDYLKQEHNIEFLYNWFECSYDEMVEQFEKPHPSPKLGNHGTLAEVLDNDAIKKYEAISGTYQIIRPYATSKNGIKFVLEVMSIQAPSGSKLKNNLLMFSHNEPRWEYIYSGQLLISNKYGIGIVKRKHETDSARNAVRCISLFVDNNKEGDGYEQRCCLSGIVTRGVKATVDGAKAVAVPFVAIRPCCNINISDTKERKLIDGLYAIENNFLIGVIDQDSKVLFSYCMKLFDDLSHEVLDGLVIKTVRPQEMQKLVYKNAETNEQYFSNWMELVKKTFSNL